MNKWLVVIVLSLHAAACTTARVRSGDGAPIYDAGIVANPGLARAESPTDSARRLLDAMSADDVKALYLECSGDATQRRLGSGEVVFCSIVYDVLLKRHFDGSFDALLAWSKQTADAAHRDRPAAQASGQASASTIAGQRWY